MYMFLLNIPAEPIAGLIFRVIYDKVRKSQEAAVEKQSRFRGCLLGLSVGDAIGTTLEFRRPNTFEPINDMIGGGPFNLKPGQWTDDTAMALCLAESLIETQDFDPRDQMKRYMRWYQEGYLSSTGTCFDIGTVTRTALDIFARTDDPFAGPTDPHTAGNGSIMRLAPVPMFFAHNPSQAINYAGESSRTTHGARAAIDACRYLAGLIVGALHGVDKETLLRPYYCPDVDCWKKRPLVTEIDAVAVGSFKEKDPPDIIGSGYVVKSLEAALWAFYKTDNFRDGCLLAANLGNDADTTAAVYGQLAGAYYGLENIPEGWHHKITHHDQIRSFADQLMANQ